MKKAFQSNFSILSESNYGTFLLFLNENQQLMFEMFESIDNVSLLLDKWNKIWSNISDYEELDSNCKSVMSITISILQQKIKSEDWYALTKNDPAFLFGLPKYAWSKNQVILDEYNRLDKLFNDYSLKHLPILNTAELLNQNQIVKSNIFYSIDLIIERTNKKEIIELLKKTTWKVKLLRNSKIQFVHPIHKITLQITFINDSDFKNIESKKVQLTENTYIPNPTDQIHFYINELKNIENWLKTDYLKQIITVKNLIKQIPRDELNNYKSIEKSIGNTFIYNSNNEPKIQIKLPKKLIIKQSIRIKQIKEKIKEKKSIRVYIKVFKKILRISLDLLLSPLRYKRDQEKIYFIPFKKIN